MVMSFDNTTDKDAPVYEAFEAALRMAEQDTKAAMRRFARTFEGNDGPQEPPDDKSPGVTVGQ
jgi:hypothetical protein